MKLKNVDDNPAPEYPSYDGYHSNRRTFLKKMLVAAGTLATGTVLSACGPTQTKGSVAKTRGRIRAPGGKGPTPPSGNGCGETGGKTGDKDQSWFGKKGDKKPGPAGDGRPVKPVKPVTKRGLIKMPHPVTTGGKVVEPRPVKPPGEMMSPRPTKTKGKYRLPRPPKNKGGTPKKAP